VPQTRKADTALERFLAQEANDRDAPLPHDVDHVQAIVENVRRIERGEEPISSIRTAA
jgi:hypothetical protein